ncbi:uncharacterized protein SEPMUDRAFT_152372 [Sphaerulina musiva SO2202]|uniref:Uncharacterized protein n=1 Tax=Sphaerulina musiva (strain SO2202) TaxID=692275 RepID=M3BPI8_SPHMS|nr:uncharacterized protein SEPMUDRAFT_152372 [Sphaerulina musiva SO2202]EMF08083.1 hypothetical protein SEPMUDRAFT_152372 [Sphaerulina musiva SO2202]
MSTHQRGSSTQKVFRSNGIEREEHQLPANRMNYMTNTWSEYPSKGNDSEPSEASIAAPCFIN